MIFQTRQINKRRNLFGNNFLKILSVCLLALFLILVINSSGPLRSLASDFFSPLFKVGGSFYEKTVQIQKNFSDKNNLVEENKNLFNEIENLRLNRFDYESIKYENQKLHEALNLDLSENLIAAKIVAKSPQIPLDSLLINKGTNEGINQGDWVLASDRVLVGKIVKVSGKQGTVALSSFPNEVSYGFILRTEEPLEIKGIGGGSLQTKVPIDFDVIIGDKIMVGGSLTYLVAIVGVIEEDHSSGFKNILMSLPVSIMKTDIVFVEPSLTER